MNYENKNFAATQLRHNLPSATRTHPPLLSARTFFNAVRHCYFEMKTNKEPNFSILCGNITKILESVARPHTHTPPQECYWNDDIRLFPFSPYLLNGFITRNSWYVLMLFISIVSSEGLLSTKNHALFFPAPPTGSYSILRKGGPKWGEGKGGIATGDVPPHGGIYGAAQRGEID